MFWDGSRWVDERARLGERGGRRARHLVDGIATLPIIVLVPALLSPFMSVGAATATLVLAAGSPTPGAALMISGSQFDPKDYLQLAWDGSSADMPSIRSGPKGDFAVVVSVPDSASPGTHVLAVDRIAKKSNGPGTPVPYSSGSDVVASLAIDVESPTPPASPLAQPPLATMAPSPTVTATPQPASTATSSPTVTPTVTPTPQPASSATPSPTPSSTSAPTPSPSATPTSTSTLGGVAVPATIDKTGSTDVSAALNSFVASVPNGSTIVFPAGATYTLSQGIQLANRSKLVFEGNGATLRTTAGANGADQLTSLFVLGHQYGGFWTGTNSGITIRDFTLVGSDTTPGYFTAGVEGQSGIEVEDSTSVEIANVTVRAVNADGVKIGGNATSGVWIHDSHVVTAGRNGITVTGGQNVTVERSAFDAAGYLILDLEPNLSSEAIKSVTFRTNTWGVWRGPEAFAADGAAGSTISGVTISGNTGSSPMRTDLTLARRSNVVFTNNTSSATAAGSVLVFANVDGLTITGNVQPLSSGTLASISNCTAVVYQP